MLWILSFSPTIFPWEKEYFCENGREASTKLGKSSVFQKKLLLDFPLSSTVIPSDNNAYSLSSFTLVDV